MQVNLFNDRVRYKGRQLPNLIVVCYQLLQLLSIGEQSTVNKRKLCETNKLKYLLDTVPNIITLILYISTKQ